MSAAPSAVEMPRPSSATKVVRALLAIAGAGACAVIALMIGAQGRPGAIVRSVDNGGAWYARSPGWFITRGLYPTEHAPDGAAFAWAGGRLRLQIPELDRRTVYELLLRGRSGRPSTEPPAVLRVVVDGLNGPVASLGAEWQEIAIALPATTRDGAVVLIESQETFTPGPQDARTLGFILDRLTLRPLDAPAVPISADVLSRVALVAGAAALAAVLCALPLWLAFAIGTAAGAAIAWLVLFDAAFLGNYSLILPSVALALAVAAAVAALLSRLAPPAVRRGWLAAALLAILVTALRLAVFLHPGAPISDGMFHVHRAQSVRAGNYLFTSVTPRPFYEFPYPVGLYIAAQPFWPHVSDRVVLLRALTLAADALVALGLFAVVSKRWASPSTGVVAAATALAVPVVVQSVSTANLTNVFAQSCFSLAVLWIGWHVASVRRAIALAGAVLLLVAGYLSHFSTAVIGAPAAGMVALCVAFSRDPREARAWRWIALSAVLALALSYVLYYSHFHEVYGRTLSRVGAEGAANSFVATLQEHSERKPVTVLRFLVLNYGWAALGLAVVGGAAAFARLWREAWTLVLMALGVVVLIFLTLGAFTPVEMRANLAAHPVVASFAAFGCAWLWQSQRIALRAAAVAGLAATVWIGLQALRAVLV